jgi:hypothetical protein
VKLNHRLQDGKLRTHVWVHPLDMQVEHPGARTFRLGLWTLLRVALHDQPWIYDNKLTGDIATLLHDIASITSLVEDGELETRMIDFYELTKTGVGMHALISAYNEIAKDLKLLQCLLPAAYIKTHKPVCYDFTRDRCARTNCRFSHDPSVATAPPEGLPGATAPPGRPSGAAVPNTAAAAIAAAATVAVAIAAATIATAAIAAAATYRWHASVRWSGLCSGRVAYTRSRPATR